MQLTPRPRYSAVQPSSAAIVRMAASTDVCTAPAIMRRRTTWQHTTPSICCIRIKLQQNITSDAVDKAASSSGACVQKVQQSPHLQWEGRCAGCQAGQGARSH